MRLNIIVSSYNIAFAVMSLFPLLFLICFMDILLYLTFSVACLYYIGRLYIQVWTDYSVYF